MLLRHPANPLLTPRDVRPSRRGWEVFGVFNAGAVLARGKTVLVLRVAERPRSSHPRSVRVPALRFRGRAVRVGVRTLSLDDTRYGFADPRKVVSAEPPHAVRFLTSLSHLRLAWSDDGIHFSVADRPWLFPDRPEEAWGCEDPRVTRLGRTFFVNYTAVSDLGIATALASTRTWRRVERHGIIFPPSNRDVTIFPETVGRLFAAYHRPMPTHGPLGMWYASSRDLVRWGGHRPVLLPRPSRWDEAKVGAGAPPIRTKDGWLTIYHGVDDHYRYALGAFLADIKRPWIVRARSVRPLLAPSASYERRGVFPNVCFTCGCVVRGGDLWVYYGAADRVLALATAPMREILRQLSSSVR